MSEMAQALDNWLSRQDNVSVLRQPTVCERFSEKTREQMISISEDSAHINKEMGAAIMQDLTLGEVVTGNRTRIIIKRPEGTTGTYHTHPHGMAQLSLPDLIDSMGYNDQVSCVGATGHWGNRIKCYAPRQPAWRDLRDQALILRNRIIIFNKKAGEKYALTGRRLTKLLSDVDTESAWKATWAAEEAASAAIRLRTADAEERAEAARIARETADKAEEANKILGEARRLEFDRKELMDKLELDLVYMHFWEPEKSIMESCRVIWEELERMPLLEE